MQTLIIEYVYLILIILALVMIANKLRLAYPIVLVLGGLVFSFTQIFSHIVIDPELIFFIFLPPLLYEAAWQTSWKEFWKWRRIITSFAFLVVILTSCVIALVSSAIIPGFTLALGFLLGGIISPPDAISATTIMRQVRAPKLLVSIAEGESLLNDASSLIIFRFALAAVITGQFYFREAAASFFLVVFMGIIVGLLVGLIFYAIHRWLPTTTSIQIVLTLITPYCMYYFAEYFHFSGVLAVVSGGLFLSSKRNIMLTYQSRIEGINVWSNIVFVLNGLVFLLIGLQLPAIVQQVENIGLPRAILYGLVITFVLIISRMLTTLGTSMFTRFISRFIKVAEPNPGWRVPVILGWTGMRGVVSLAAALSIPLYISAGEPFPYRNLILFITFVVILISLVLQGLTLPLFIRKLKLEDRFNGMPEYEQEIIIQKKIAQYSLEYLNEKHGEELNKNVHFNNLQERLKAELNFYNQELEETGIIKDNSLKSFQSAYLELLDHQRKVLNKINHKSEFDEEIIRKYLSLVDMEEFNMRQKLLQDSNK